MVQLMVQLLLCPEVDAQNEEINAVQVLQSDFATDPTYRQIHNVAYDTFINTHGGIDKQTQIDGKSPVFVNPYSIQ